MLTAIPDVNPVTTGFGMYLSSADAQQSSGDQHEASHERTQDQAAVAEFVAHVVDDWNKSRGRSADLHSGSAEQ
jgi:hypothetical protein